MRFRMNKKSMAKIGIAMLILIIPLIAVWGVNLANSYGVDGAYNVTINNTQILPNPAYANSLLNCSSKVYINSTTPVNVSINIYNGSNLYSSSIRINALNGEIIQEPIINLPKPNNLFLHYRLSELNGSNLKDSVGNNSVVFNPGIWLTTGNATWGYEFGKFGGGILIRNGTTSMASTATPNFNVTTAGFYGNMTMCSWINVTRLNNDYTKLFGDYKFMQVVQTTNSGSIYAQRTNISGTTADTNVATYRQNLTGMGWTLICYSISGVSNEGKELGIYNATIYFNTTAVASNLVYGNQSTEGLHKLTYQIGADSEASFDELMLWNTSFSKSDIIDLYGSFLKPTDNWNCSMNGTDSAGGISLLSSVNFTNFNQYPILSNLFINPSISFANNNLYCSANYSDAENDPQQKCSQVKWYRSIDGGTTYSLTNTTSSNPSHSDVLLLHFENDINSSDGINATFGQNYTFEAGKFGQGLKLNGKDNCIRFNLTNASRFFDGNEFTVEMWIKLNQDENILANYTQIYSIMFNDSNANRVHLEKYVNTWENTFYSGSGSGTYVVEPDPRTSWYAGYWHHLATTFSRTEGITFYVDGRFAHINSTTTSPFIGWNTTNYSIGIGNYYTCSNPFNGTIDEFRIINKILTGEEIKDDYLRDTSFGRDEEFLNYLSGGFNESDKLICSRRPCDTGGFGLWYNSSVLSIQSKKKVNVTINYGTQLSVISLKYGINDIGNSGFYPGYNYSMGYNNFKQIDTKILRLWMQNDSYSYYYTFPYFNKTLYNYTELNRQINFSLSIGAIPMLSIATAPNDMTDDGTTGNCKYPLSFENFSLMCANMTKYYFDMCTNGSWEAQGYLPCNNVSDWYWLIWNEPNCDYWWKGNQQNFTLLYNLSRGKMKEINSSIKVGVNLLGMGVYVTGNQEGNYLINPNIEVIKNTSTPDFDKFLSTSAGLDFIASNHYGNSELSRTESGNVDYWIMNSTKHYRNLADYIRNKLLIYGFGNLEFHLTEINIDGSKINPFQWQVLGKSWYGSFLNQLVRDNNLTGEQWFSASGGMSNPSMSQNYGMWQQLDNNVSNISSGTWQMKKSFVTANTNGSIITDCSTSSNDIECLSIKRGGNNGANILTLINKAYAITDVNVTLDSSLGLIWDIQSYNYIADINQTLAKYNVTFIGLDADKFNLTEGQNTGLLDTNGNEITDDVDNKVWILSNATLTRKVIGNNLSIPVNVTAKMGVAKCDFADDNGIMAYNRPYDSGSYNCVNNVLTLELTNLPVGMNDNYINITYKTVSGSVGETAGGGGSTGNATTLAQVTPVIANVTEQDNIITNITGAVIDSTSDALSNIKMNENQFWITICIIAGAAIIVASLYSWKAGVAIAVIGGSIIAIIASQNGLISFG